MTTRLHKTCDDELGEFLKMMTGKMGEKDGTLVEQDPHGAPH